MTSLGVPDGRYAALDWLSAEAWILELEFVTVESGRNARKSPVGDDKGPVRESSYSALASAANVSLLVSRLDVRGAVTISVSDGSCSWDGRLSSKTYWS